MKSIEKVERGERVAFKRKLDRALFGICTVVETSGSSNPRIWVRMNSGILVHTYKRSLQREEHS